MARTTTFVFFLFLLASETLALGTPAKLNRRATQVEVATGAQKSVIIVKPQNPTTGVKFEVDDLVNAPITGTNPSKGVLPKVPGADQPVVPIVGGGSAQVAPDLNKQVTHTVVKTVTKTASAVSEPGSLIALNQTPLERAVLWLRVDTSQIGKRLC